MPFALLIVFFRDGSACALTAPQFFALTSLQLAHVEATHLVGVS